MENETITTDPIQIAKNAAIQTAIDLSKEIGVEIIPIVLAVNNEPIVGFIKKPNRQVKLAAFDDTLKSPSQGGETIFNACFLQKDSDKRIEADDDIYISFCIECMSLFKLYPNELKKK